MKTYAIHSMLVETPDLQYMLDRFPDRPSYGDLYLFPEVHLAPTIEVIDLTGIDDLERFDAAYQELNQQEHVGRWVHINQVQGRFLLNKYFSTESVEEVV